MKYFYNDLFITEVQEYGKRHQEVFPKIVILMSQKHPKTIIKIKSNPWKIHVKKFFFSKFADWRGKISEERFSWNSLGACFRKYAISLKVVARLKNLEVKIPYVKKYMTQNPEKP